DGATVVAANKEARKPEKTIDGDDDSFVRNACAAQKWIILELSQLGRVDEVELVMTEMYSSRVRDFSVKGRQSHPRKDGPSSDYPRFFDSESWQLLGDFTAANRKGAQLFKMPLRRRIRYLLFQFHTHYGAEEVCALNSISVLGVPTTGLPARWTACCQCP
ncbi:SUN domain-containing protein 2, partial [Haematococcus lacustris]